MSRSRFSRARMILARFGLVFAALACVATSYENEGETCGRDSECESGWLCCDGLCVDPDWHDDNCGGCGIECSTERTCTEASCTLYESSGIHGNGVNVPMSLPAGVEIEPSLQDLSSPASAEMPLAL